MLILHFKSISNLPWIPELPVYNNIKPFSTSIIMSISPVILLAHPQHVKVKTFNYLSNIIKIMVMQVQ